MTGQRPFRLGVQLSRAESGAEEREKAIRAEGLGYDILHMPDYLGGQPAIGPEQIPDTPSLLMRTIDATTESVRERRERLGISCVVAFERDVEAFAPVVARLAGT